MRHDRGAERTRFRRRPAQGEGVRCARLLPDHDRDRDLLRFHVPIEADRARATAGATAVA